MSYKFPKRQYLTEEDIEYVTDVLRTQNFSQFSAGKYNGGFEVVLFEYNFKKYLGIDYATTFNSCTSALQAALLACYIGPGDRVIVPAYSFASSAAAVLQVGAEPIFCDIEMDTFALDIAGKTLPESHKDVKAIILVHLLGYPAKQTKLITEICRAHGWYLIEDCAQALGAEIDGKKVGTFGDIGCYSFGHSKQISTGEGGMCVTNNSDIDNRLEMIRNHAHCFDGSRLLGYNMKMTEIQAAMGYRQLLRIDELNKYWEINAGYLTGMLYTMKMDECDMLDFVKPYHGRVHSMYDMWVGREHYKIAHLNKHAGEKIFYSGYTKPIYDLPIFEPYKPDKPLDNTEWCCGHAIWTPHIFPPFDAERMEMIAKTINNVFGDVTN